MVRDSGGRRPAGTISSYLRARLTTPGCVGQRFGTPTAWIMVSSQAAIISPRIRKYIRRFVRFALDMEKLPNPLNPQPLPLKIALRLLFSRHFNLPLKGSIRWQGNCVDRFKAT